MAIDLTALSPAQLQALIVNAESHMQQARASQVQEVRSKIDALLSQSGLTLADIYPNLRGGRVAKSAGRRSTVAPKYRNPENPAETWSGRGRQPLWLAQALKRRGVKVEDFLIEGASAKGSQATKSAKATKAPAARKTRVAKKVTRNRVKR